MDDGSLSKNSYCFNTQGFHLKDIEKLKLVLDNNFSIKSNLHKDKNSYKLYIFMESKDIFIKTIEDFILPSFHYKIDKSFKHIK